MPAASVCDRILGWCLEFGFALTLLAGARLAIRSFLESRPSRSWRSELITFLTFLLPVPDGRLLQPEQMVAFYRERLTRIKAAPGVSAVAASTGLPVAGTQAESNFGSPARLRSIAIRARGRRSRRSRPATTRRLGYRSSKDGSSLEKTPPVAFRWPL